MIDASRFWVEFGVGGMLVLVAIYALIWLVDLVAAGVAHLRKRHATPPAS